VELRKRRGVVVAMKGAFGFIETDFSDGEKAEYERARTKAANFKNKAIKLRAAATAAGAEDTTGAAEKAEKAEAVAEAAAKAAAEAKVSGKLRLFFHSAEVQEGVELGEKDSVEFVVVRNRHKGEKNALRVTLLERAPPPPPPPSRPVQSWMKSKDKQDESGVPGSVEKKEPVPAVREARLPDAAGVGFAYGRGKGLQPVERLKLPMGMHSSVIDALRRLEEEAEEAAEEGGGRLPPGLGANNATAAAPGSLPRRASVETSLGGGGGGGGGSATKRLNMAAAAFVPVTAVPASSSSAGGDAQVEETKAKEEEQGAAKEAEGTAKEAEGKDPAPEAAAEEAEEAA